MNPSQPKPAELAGGVLTLLVTLAGCGGDVTELSGAPELVTGNALRCLAVLEAGDPALQSGSSTRDVLFVGESLYTLSSCVQRWNPLSGEELRDVDAELRHVSYNGDEALHRSRVHGFLGMSDGGRFYPWSANETYRAGAQGAEPAFAVTTGGYRKTAFVDGFDRFAVYSKERIDFVDRATSEPLTEQALEQGIDLVVGASHSYVTALGDHRIVLWPASDLVKGMVLTGHGAPVIAMAYRADESGLASVDREGQVLLWDLTTGIEVRRWSLQVSQAVPSAEIAFTPDGELLAANGSDDTISFWSTETGELVDSLVVPGAGILALDIDDEGSLLAVGLAHRGRFDQNALRKIQETYADPRILESGPALVFDLSNLRR